VIHHHKEEMRGGRKMSDYSHGTRREFFIHSFLISFGVKISSFHLEESNFRSLINNQLDINLADTRDIIITAIIIAGCRCCCWSVEKLFLFSPLFAFAPILISRAIKFVDGHSHSSICFYYH
jgi:hypothetical protein